MKTKLKPFDIKSFTKLQIMVFGAIGLFAGILYSFGGFFIDLFVSLGWLSSLTFETPGLSYGTVLAFGALLGMPIIFGLFGLIYGVFGGLSYNLSIKLYRYFICE